MSHSTRKPRMVLNDSQLQCLTSPLRSELLSILMAEGPMSVADLGRRTGHPQKSLYYPLRKLVQCGLAHPAAISKDGRRPEQLFDAAVDEVQLPESAPGIRDPSNRALIGVMSVALREVVRATETAPELDVVCHRTVARLSDKDRDELLRMLKEVSDFVRDRSDHEAPAYSLTMALAPRVFASRRSVSSSEDENDSTKSPDVPKGKTGNWCSVVGR